MIAWLESCGLWLADVYLASTLLLLITAVVARWLSQPVRRLTLAWATMAGLAALLLLCYLPAWPKVHVRQAPAARVAARPPVLAPAESPVFPSALPDDWLPFSRSSSARPADDASSWAAKSESANSSPIFSPPSRRSNQGQVHPGEHS